uniref:Uncharacterized protein n=1 Tax=Rheinheimera sp. BAL341 TaxID=1708203 RepID=A0A486XLN5_9GAMM
MLKFRVENLQIKKTLRLKQFGITEQQCEQLQLLALSGLQSK